MAQKLAVQNIIRLKRAEEIGKEISVKTWHRNSSAKTSLNWLQKWAMAMWEVAKGKISVLLFTSWYRKSQNLMVQ